MPRRTVPVLVDTNVILECHRTRSWTALTSGYCIETVTVCVMETQTGAQRRRPEQQIGAEELAKLANVLEVTNTDFANAFVRDPQIAVMDPGEQALWVHALTRTDAWVLCGPDNASMRIGVRLGLRDRLVSLEELLTDAGYRPRIPLNRNYTSRWLAECLNRFVLLEGEKKR